MVREGYKQTEIGVIPKDWEVIELASVASVGSGGTPSRKVDEYWNGDIPWITTTLINGRQILVAEEYITKLGLINSAAKAYNPGTLLMAMYGQGKTRGKVAQLGITAAVNQACAAIVLDESISASFVFHFLISRYNEIRELSNSGGQENLSSGIVKSLKLLRPTTREQLEIAKALSESDELIDGLEALIAKKRALKTATMQQLLTGKTRLAGFGEGKSTKQSDVGEIPEDWEEIRVGDILAFKNGLNKAKAFFGFGTPIVNYMDVFGHPGISADDVQGLVSVSTEEKSAYSVKKGDIFFTRTSETVDEIGMSAVLQEDIADGVFSGFVLRGRDKGIEKKLSLGFKKYCFRSEVFRKQIRSSASYTTRALTNGRLLSNAIVSVPSDLDEQDAIAEVLFSFDLAISALEIRLKKNIAIKQGMMQELLTGRTRLI